MYTRCDEMALNLENKKSLMVKEVTNNFMSVVLFFTWLIVNVFDDMEQYFPVIIARRVGLTLYLYLKMRTLSPAL